MAWAISLLQLLNKAQRLIIFPNPLVRVENGILAAKGRLGGAQVLDSNVPLEWGTWWERDLWSQGCFGMAGLCQYAADSYS